MTQLLAAVITAVYAIICTVVILKVMDMFMQIRVDRDSEAKGLDLAEHEERGYNL